MTALHPSNSLTNGEVLYIAKNATTRDEIVRSLSALLPMRERCAETHQSTYYDTFDGRLTRAGAKLEVASAGDGQRLRWTNGEPGHAHELALPVPVGFVWDLPDGPLRSALEPVIEMRRLLPLVEMESESRWLAIVDERDKAVARLRLDIGRARAPNASASWQQLPPLLRVVPVRGYDRDYARLCAIVESRPGVEPCPHDPQRLVLEAAGVARPRDVSAWRAHLDHDVTAIEGLRQIHRALLKVVLANEAGVRADLDSEFLHDFRVAVRRTRAVLTQLKDVYPAEAVARFKPELSWLQGITGPTRDLDVFLLDVREAHVDLPPEDLEVLRKHLTIEQQRSHREMVEQLDTSRYHELIDGWRRFLEGPIEPDATASNANRPLVDVASKVAWRLYRRMVKRGKEVNGETPVEVLHEIRLDAKKLRYLIDCTRSLYGAKRVARLVSALKRLQDVLGNYNDAEIQQERLHNYAESLAVEGVAGASTAFNLGRLAERSRERAALERQRFGDRFEEFASTKTRAVFRALFKADDKSGRKR